MKIFDIFCDASVDKSLRGSCAGALVTNRETATSLAMYADLQPHGTNNSGEIAAVMLGVLAVSGLRYQIHEPCQFNIFSDSIISIKGIREWIFRWIASKDPSSSKFTNSSGEPVSNQVYFKCIYNIILMNGLDIKFYHQYGHVNPTKFHKASDHFVRENGIPVIRLGGMTIEKMSMYNNYVDSKTREILNSYTNVEAMPTLFQNPALDRPLVFDQVVPYVRICDVLPEQFGFDMHLVDASPMGVARYANLIHAFEYPSGETLTRFVTRI